MSTRSSAARRTRRSRRTEATAGRRARRRPRLKIGEPTALGDRVRTGDQRAALQAGAQARPGSCALGDGPSTSQAGACPPACAHEGRKGCPLSSAGRTAAGHGVGHGAPARQEGPREAQEDGAGRADSSARRIADAAGAVRPWDDGQRLAGNGDGTALGGQVVRVLTAPDNGLGQFSQAAVVTTAANGGWSAHCLRGRRGWWRPSTTAGRRPKRRSLGAGASGRAGQGEAAQRLAAPRGVGRDGADHGAAGRRVSAGRWRARAVADRSGVDLSDLRRAGARDGQRALLDDVYVRRRAGEQLPAVLVPAVVPAHGFISIFAK